ncbi:hypothetical protein A33I_14400 [Alkalihalophilus marmarensis DSM 21297]|uniref:Uncharacterized protein n=1 Tax=Alkalihalophilus marmarensis DSM 21297 TaxID=1188261 RepID=U6SPR0_9BACI|nr:hypothetical protein A33I_14400 [Alkalihalophilus marmarensis DSM 21297]
MFLFIRASFFFLLLFYVYESIKEEKIEHW